MTTPTFATLPTCSTERNSIVFYLIRHAQSEANVGGNTEQETDSPLTAFGREQAQVLAYLFQTIPLTSIFSSDSLRARDTVAPLASMSTTRVSTSEQLREPHNAQRSSQFMDAKQAAELLEHWRTSTEIPAPIQPSESSAQLVTRLQAFLRELWSPNRHGAIMICSHYVTLNHLVRLLIDPHEPRASVWAHFDNSSVTRVDVPLHHHSPVGVIKYLNWVPTFPAPPDEPRLA
jgi:broad specificity phosphatase PhoE